MELKKNKFEILLFLLFLLVTGFVKGQSVVKYEIADKPWEENLGNHRTVIEVSEASNAVHLDYLWRRHDKKIANKEFVFINRNTGERVENIHRVKISNEKCELVFGPVEKGIYDFYYLPYIVQEVEGYYGQGYRNKENEPSNYWLKIVKTNFKTIPKVKAKAIQARLPFDSFYPMEVIATLKEKNNYVNDFGKGEFLLFTEGRKNPIRMLDDIPLKWIEEPLSNQFVGKALRNEYYTFQLGLWACYKGVENVKVAFTNLVNENKEIDASKITCFNTGGVDPLGKPFKKRIDVEKDELQPLWIGVDIGRDVTPGTYTGTVTITADNVSSQKVRVNIIVNKNVIEDRGDSETWRHSRLRWLNSTAGINDNPTSNYTPIKKEDGTFKILGRELVLNKKGFPRSIKAGKAELLKDDIQFIIETNKGEESFKVLNESQLKEASGIISSDFNLRNKAFDIKTNFTLESDGYLLYKVHIIANKNVDITDVRLEIPFDKNVAKYVMGMGLVGSIAPDSHQAKWKGPHDAFWLGDTNAGLHCELRGASYMGPLLNAYKPDYPKSWYNDGKGEFKIETDSSIRKVIVSSGNRKIKKGEQLDFEFAFIITPVKKVDTKSQFTNRYFHNALKPTPSEEDVETGIKVINVHHANKYNPYINYPFIKVPEMKGFVDKWHNRGMKVKIYYTIRELTNYVEEIWALRSLGDEIIYNPNKEGTGFPWLREHFISNYDHRWYQRINSTKVDASIRNTPDVSRWYNYYVEGLKWLVKNVDIDGIYLDDVAYDRNMLKRMKKVMDEVKPGCFIDLHSNTWFSKGPATQYTEFFPYIDKIWFGESFLYDEMKPANWLIESSGIPFGLMGDMLQGGGNPWRGMVFGMSSRLPWVTEGKNSSPTVVWKVWDDFGIMDSKMIGYWEEEPIITTTNKDVPATVYLKEGKMLISIASWADNEVKVKLNINWEKAGLNPDNVKLFAPSMDGFQPERIFELNEFIPIEPTKGWLLIVE